MTGTLYAVWYVRRDLVGEEVVLDSVHVTEPRARRAEEALRQCGWKRTRVEPVEVRRPAMEEMGR